MIDVRSIVTTEINRRGYRQFPANNIVAFSIDSAMDTDADTFSIDLGAPTPDLKFLVDRDNEVRATIFTSSPQARNVSHLHSGIADVVSYSSDDHVISIAGRDVSSLATDSQAPPGEIRHVRPHRLVASEAAALGITRLRLADVQAEKKFYRDGSESYWESWYRLYRNRKMWIWAEPDGTLIADKLHYANSPTYFFGVPTKRSARSNWQAVERVVITKDTQRRVGEVWVFGERGDLGFMSKAIDPSIRSWKKRPLRIQTSSTAKNRVDALREAWEEIFEGKVGSLEITITVPLSHTGRLVRQNQMAEVNVPDMGLHGIFFVVGVALRGGPNGYTQEVRLREKNYAITRRVPDEPLLDQDPTADQVIPGDIGAILRASGIRWANSFASAAQEFHGGWPFDLFLGVLLAMCDKESGFRNVREGSDTEWYPRPTGASAGEQAAEGTTTGSVQGAGSVDAWRRNFANAEGSGGNPFGREAGVGPMQLTDKNYKVWADEYGGKRDEYEGGRWIPQANIRAGARVLAEKLKGLDPGNPSLIWEGVRRYNGSGVRAYRYRDDVRARYNTRYKATVEAIEKSANVVRPGETTNVKVTDAMGNPFTVEVPVNASPEVKKFVNYLIRQIGKPYGWGHEGPSSFDCSGLIMAAARSAGGDALRVFANAGRPTTYTLYANPQLKKVAKDNLIAGDLVFFSNLGHVGIYLNDGHFIHAPQTGDVVKISPFNSTWARDRYVGARRIFDWFVAGVTDFPSSSTSPSTAKTKTVMIQAGHDPGANNDQPYGHTGQSGAPGEVAFTKAVRDAAVGFFENDSRFVIRKGTAWSASAGATAGAGDDLDFTGDVFISVHHDTSSGNSRYFFGWPTGRGATVESESLKLRDAFVQRYNALSGHPTRNTGLDNSNEALYGYYAWGHASRAFPDSVDHTPGVDARLLIECGGGPDIAWLNRNERAIGRAIYLAVCDYYNYKPLA